MKDCVTVYDFDLEKPYKFLDKTSCGESKIKNLSLRNFLMFPDPGNLFSDHREFENLLFKCNGFHLGLETKIFLRETQPTPYYSVQLCSLAAQLTAERLQYHN